MANSNGINFPYTPKTQLNAPVKIDYKALAKSLMDEYSPLHETESVLREWLAANGIIYILYHDYYYLTETGKGREGLKLDQRFSNLPECLTFCLEFVKQRIKAGE